MSYKLPSCFTDGGIYVHVTPDNMDAFMEVVANEGLNYYRDYRHFITKWHNDEDGYVVCYYDAYDKCVHINGDFYYDDESCETFEFEDLYIDDEADAVFSKDFLDLL